MLHKTSTALALGLVAHVAAQASSPSSISGSVTSIFLPFVDQQNLVASIAGETGDLKTLVVQCPNGTPTESCGLPDGITVTAGPSTMHVNTVVSGIGSLDVECMIAGTTEATCVETYSGVAAVDTTDTMSAGSSVTTSGTTTTTLSISEMLFLPVTITAGAGVSGGTTSTMLGHSSSPPSSSFSGSSSKAGSSATATATASETNAAVGSSLTMRNVMLAGIAAWVVASF